MTSHWSQYIKEVVASINVDIAFGTLFAGGAENGQFWWIADVRKELISYRSGKFERDDILLEINGERVCGYTAEDLILWVKQVTGPTVFKVVRGSLTKDLREYLSTRFQKDSVDYDLQQTIRNNLYRRTIPCTTRAARPGEINGVDYTFLSVDEFLALENSGKLLESGCYEGNYYGTPLPNSQLLKINSNGVTANGSGEDYSHNEAPLSVGIPVPLPLSGNIASVTDQSLSPGESSAVYNSIYYTAVGDEGDELPYGWERVEDPRYGVYYIDHIHKKTQYERPSVHENVFTKDPGEMRGDFVKTTLVKGAHGLGFTIVGGDLPDTAFLQIRDVVPLGPAYNDGALQPGDVLVYVNGVCVLGYAHQDILHMFQSMQIGESVVLEVCRGYPPLLYDPRDSEVEVAKSVAFKPDVSSRGQFRIVGNNLPSPLQPYFHSAASPSSPSKNSFGFVPNPDESAVPRKMSGEFFHQPATTPVGIKDLAVAVPQFLRISIMKGTQGFGFTIADSLYGQRVRQVIDRQRCKSLAEGDLLLEVNRIGVKDMPHQQVVQLLKNCLSDMEVSFLIQRGGIPPPLRSAKSPVVNYNANALVEMQPSQELVKALNEQPETPSVEDDNVPGSRNSKVAVSRSSARAPADFSPERRSRSEKRVTMSPSALVDQSPIITLPKAVNRSENAARLNRSRTSGPDFLRSDDRNFDEMEWKTRSKTPTPQRQSAAVINNKPTTPNFVPASDYPTIEKPSPQSTAVSSGNPLQVGQGHERIAPGRLLPLTPTHRISNNNNTNNAIAQSSRNGNIAGFGAGRDGVNGQGVDRRRLAEPPSYAPPTSVALRAAGRGTFDVTLVRRVDEGFGFVIASSSTQTDTTIGRIIDGTPAQRCGRLAVGDRILAMNGTSLHQMKYDSVMNVLQQSGYSIVLTISRDDQLTSGGVSSPTAGPAAVDPRWKLDINNNGRRNDVRPVSRQLPAIPRPTQLPPPSSAEAAKRPNNLRILPDTEKVYTVDLLRGARGFGFSIRGGREFGNMPLYVLSIAEGGPADIDGRLKVGDQILEISGRITENASHAEVVDLIQNGGPMIRVVAKRTSVTLPQTSRRSPLLEVTI